MRVINCLWIGSELGYLEQLCIRSALAVGHPVHLYSYASVAGVPEGAVARDAAEVMSKDELLERAGSKWSALASDLWRYELLSQGRGYWCDLDVLFLKPFDSDDQFVFGYQDETTVNGAVLYAPSGSEFVADLRAALKPNRCPAWFGPKRTAKFYLQRLKGRVGLEDMPWGTYGPDLITHMVRRHGIEPMPRDVFYPIPWQRAQIIYEPAPLARQFITDDTRAVHLWHGRLGDLAKRPPAPGSFIAEMCERFGVFERELA